MESPSYTEERPEYIEPVYNPPPVPSRPREQDRNRYTPRPDPRHTLAGNLQIIDDFNVKTKLLVFIVHPHILNKKVDHRSITGSDIAL